MGKTICANNGINRQGRSVSENAVGVKLRVSRSMTLVKTLKTSCRFIQPGVRKVPWLGWKMLSFIFLDYSGNIKDNDGALTGITSWPSGSNSHTDIRILLQHNIHAGNEGAADMASHFRVKFSDMKELIKLCKDFHHTQQKVIQVSGLVYQQEKRKSKPEWATGPVNRNEIKAHEGSNMETEYTGMLNYLTGKWKIPLRDELQQKAEKLKPQWTAGEPAKGNGIPVYEESTKVKVPGSSLVLLSYNQTVNKGRGIRETDESIRKSMDYKDIPRRTTNMDGHLPYVGSPMEYSFIKPKQMGINIQNENMGQALQENRGTAGRGEDLTFKDVSGSSNSIIPGIRRYRPGVYTEPEIDEIISKINMAEIVNKVCREMESRKIFERERKGLF